MRKFEPGIKYTFRELIENSVIWFGAMQEYKGAVMDVPATMAALAWAESHGKTDAVGDGGTSWGLWQINSKVWDVDEWILKDVKAQVAAARIILIDALDAVAWAVALRGSRRALLEQPDLPRQIDEVTAAQWVNIVWQYGATQFRDWIERSNDHTPDGFKAYKKEVKKPVHWGFNSRQARFATDYMRADGVIKKNPSFWKDVVVQTGKDLADMLAGKKDPPKPPPWAILALVVAGLYFLQPLTRAVGSRLEKKKK